MHALCVQHSSKITQGKLGAALIHTGSVVEIVDGKAEAPCPAVHALLCPLVCWGHTSYQGPQVNDFAFLQQTAIDWTSREALTRWLHLC